MAGKFMFKWSKQITPSQVEQLIRAEKDIHKATLIFDSATAEYSNGYRHDHTTFGLIISKFASANQFRLAENIIGRMKEENCEITEDIFLTICRAYARVHRPLDSVRVFHIMKDYKCEPTEKSYITVFSILVEENMLKVALRFYKYMRGMGIKPSVVSLNILIKALCKNSGTLDAALKIFHEMPNQGCAPDSYTYGTLINGFAKLGKINEARELLKEMERKGCLPSVVTYTSLIHGLCQSNNVEDAMNLFEEMKNKGIEPNVFTYSSMMDGLCGNGYASRAMELLGKMIIKRQKPNMITYSTLINGLCKEGKLLEAVEILDRMKLQGVKPDAGLYGKIIIGFCDVCKFQEAANFIDEMVLSGVSPNRLTSNLHARVHNMVIQGLCTKGNPNRAFQLYLSMHTRDILVSAETFESLVKYCCKKGDLHKVSHVIDEMVVNGCVPDEETWSVVINGFWDRKKFRDGTETFLVRLMSELDKPVT